MSTEDKIRLVACLTLLMAAGYPIAMNWGAIIANARNRRRGIPKHYSPGPFISIVLASWAYAAAYPFGSKQWILIVPALDIGNWQALIGLALMVRGALRRG